MKPDRMFAACACALLVSMVAITAAAQTAPPTRLRGTITEIDGKTATITTREGNAVKINLAENWSVALVSALPASEIKQGSFVGIASVKAADGSLSALEVLVFPRRRAAATRGTIPGICSPRA